MINVSQEFKEKMQAGNCNWLVFFDIYLGFNNILHLTNEDIWSGSVSLEDSVSADGTFGSIGAVIINSLTFAINNMDGRFSNYNFMGKSVKFYVGLELSNGSIERFQKGEFFVADIQTNGYLLTLTCYDAMAEFDLYTLGDWGPDFPITVRSLLDQLCGDIGYTLATINFPNANYVIETAPKNMENITGREVISWCATLAGCFARFNRVGELEIGWFDQDSLMSESLILNGGVFDNSSPKYSTGDTADGGAFNPWDIGYEINIGGYSELTNIHNIFSTFSTSISQNDVKLAGLKVIVDTETEEKVHYIGSPTYCVEIPKTEFITESNYSTIAGNILNKISGFKFRSCEVTCISNPTIEAGDIAILWDPRTRVSYPIIISRTVFSVDGQQQIYSSAKAPSSLETGFSARQTEASKNYVETLNRIDRERDSRERAIAALSTSLSASTGLYSTIISVGQVDPLTGEKVISGNLYYLHDKEDLLESSVLWKMNAEAWAVSTNGGNTWNGGMTVNGDVIARILSATGINADWIRTGEISDANGNTSFNLSTGLLSSKSLSINSPNFSLSTLGVLKATNAEISGRISTKSSDSEAILLSGGTNYYKNDKFIGRIGANNFLGTSNHGLEFGLETEGSYIGWCSKNKATDSVYTAKMIYANKAFKNYTADAINLGCDIDMKNYKLKNVKWEDGGITGKMTFDKIFANGINSDGTVGAWVANCYLQFKNGILISAKWS